MCIEYKTFSDCRTFGVEMELDPHFGQDKIGEILTNFESLEGLEKNVYIESKGNRWAESKHNDYWHVKYDSSCGPTGSKKNGGGWEVASYIAINKEELLSIASSADFLKFCGAKVNNYCGLHIHANVANFSIGMMGIALAHWVKIESIMLQACPERRRRNRHCKPLRRKINTYVKLSPRDFYFSLSPTYLGPHENNDKRYTLNLVGYTRMVNSVDDSRPTLELRLPECLLDKSHVKGWTTLFLHFLNTSSNFKAMPKTLQPASLIETLEILGLSGNDENFIILDKHLYDTKIWFLNRLIEYATQPGLKQEAKRILSLVSNLRT